MSARLKPRLTDGQEADIAQYRALSGSAVTGLIFGLLSPVWLIDPLLWVCLPTPVLGVAFSSLALWRLRRHAPILIGRKAALAGLMLSLLFGTAAPTGWLAYRWAVRREARQFACHWFDLLATGQAHRAYHLTRDPRDRWPAGGAALDDYYRVGSPGRAEVEDYLARQPVRTLAALGNRAQVRYYGTSGQGPYGDRDLVYQTYAVTYEDREGGGKKTFFVGLSLERIRLDSGRAKWQLKHAESGFKPDGL